MNVDLVEPEPDSGTPGTAPEATPLEFVSSFALLLARLSSDASSAATVYEDLRRRLIAYFRLHLPAEAETLADAAFDRIAKKLSEATDVKNIYHYAFGVARNLLLEEHARFARARMAAEDPTFSQIWPADGNEDRHEDDGIVFSALSACLKMLGKSQQAEVLAYYGGEGAARIGRRRALAAETGISLNALANRMLRLREQLERCILKRLSQEA